MRNWGVVDSDSTKYMSDWKSESGWWKSGKYCTIYVSIMPRYHQNTVTYSVRKMCGWNSRFLVVKLAQLQWSGFLWGKTCCNGLVPGWNRTPIWIGNLEPLLTLPPTPLPAVQCISIIGMVLHLNHGILWLSPEIASFLLGSILPARLGSPEIGLSCSFSLCIPPPVISHHIMPILSPSSFFSSLHPPVFSIILFQLVLANYPPVLAWAIICIVATIRGDQNLHSFPLAWVSHQDLTVLSTWSIKSCGLMSGCWWVSSVEAQLC